MCKMSDEELYSVAIHEAGHVVAANLLDLLIRGTEIYLSEKGRWFGKSPTNLSKKELVGIERIFPPEFLFKNGAIVSVAGFLAQAKHAFMQSHGTACLFDLTVDLAPLISFFRDSSLNDDVPGVAFVPFTVLSTGEARVCELSGLNFSGADRHFFLKNLQSAPSASPELIVQESMQILDDRKNWRQVKELATMLVEQEPTGDNQRRVLASEQISQLLSKDSIQ